MTFNLQLFTHTLGRNITIIIIIIITSVIYTHFELTNKYPSQLCESSIQLRGCDLTDFSEPPAQFERKLTKHVGQLITNNEHSSMRRECFQTPGALWQLPPRCCDVLEKVTPGSISGSVAWKWDCVWELSASAALCQLSSSLFVCFVYLVLMLFSSSSCWDRRRRSKPESHLRLQRGCRC